MRLAPLHLGTLDYIFYTDDTLAPLSLLELPAEVGLYKQVDLS
jgi:hypothetical protein